MKFWAGRNISWDQDCWEKYQQLQICGWHYPNDRKWRGTKDQLDEGEKGEWKSWLKVQQLKKNINIQKTKIMASGPITSWQIDEETMKEWHILFYWAPKSLQMVTTAMESKDTYSLKKAASNLKSTLKRRRYFLIIHLTLHFNYMDSWNVVETMVWT